MENVPPQEYRPFTRSFSSTNGRTRTGLFHTPRALATSKGPGFEGVALNSGNVSGGDTRERERERERDSAGRFKKRSEREVVAVLVLSVVVVVVVTNVNPDSRVVNHDQSFVRSVSLHTCVITRLSKITTQS